MHFDGTRPKATHHDWLVAGALGLAWLVSQVNVSPLLHPFPMPHFFLLTVIWLMLHRGLALSPLLMVMMALLHDLVLAYPPGITAFEGLILMLILRRHQDMLRVQAMEMRWLLLSALLAAVMLAGWLVGSLLSGVALPFLLPCWIWLITIAIYPLLAKIT